MQNKLTSIFLFLTIGCFSLMAQKHSIVGRIIDGQESSALAGVSVVLTNAGDSIIRHHTVTNDSGFFSFKGVTAQAYILKTYYIGYIQSSKGIIVKKSMEDLGTIKLIAKKMNIEEVVFVKEAPPVVLNGDTTEMRASAFKVNADATVEDLIKKMPTVMVDKTGVTAQGEKIKKVLVDGKPFFGEDPLVAVKNLPADIVDKIQIYNALSDQAQLTGFNDDNTSKTMNIVTKTNSRNGTFGKLSAGAGSEGKYLAGCNMNIFKGNQRLSVLGLSNNVNQQNFSTNDLSGKNNGKVLSGEYGGGYNMGNSDANYQPGQQNGIIKTNSLGLNYNSQMGTKLKVSGSYFYSNTGNAVERTAERTYPGQNNDELFNKALETYNDTSLSNIINQNHRVNARVEYTIDSMNMLIVTPRVSFQDNGSNSLGYTFYKIQNEPEITIREAISNRNLNTKGINLYNDITFRHRFLKKGRTISLNIGSFYNNQEPANVSRSTTNNYKYTAQVWDTLPSPNNQLSLNLNNTLEVSPGLVYTEPIGEKGLLQLNYLYSFKRNKANKETYVSSKKAEPANYMFNPIDSLNLLLSNAYENKNLSNKAGVGYKFSNKIFSGTISLNYQNSILSGNTTMPVSAEVYKVFNNFLPSATFRYNYSGRNNVSLNYQTSTREPSIFELQTVLNNINSLNLSIGNSGLKQEYTHRLMARVANTNTSKSTNLFLFVSGSLSSNPITNSVYRNIDKDTVIQNIFIAKGVSFSNPVNTTASCWQVNSTLSYGFPLKVFKSNINLSSGVNYITDPGLNNGITNLSKNLSFTEGIVVSSNISENVDFTITYSANYSIIKNSVISTLNNKYFFYTVNVRLTLVPWEGLVIQNEATNQYNRGFSSNAYNHDYWAWNASIAKKIFNKKADIKLTVYDILKQNKAIGHTVNNQYIEDSRTNALQRFLMLTFTYNLRTFGMCNSNAKL